MTILTSEDRRSFAETAKSVRTAAAVISLAETVNQRGAADYSDCVRAIEQEARENGIYIRERAAAKRLNIGYSSLRRAVSRGEFPKPDQLGENRIGYCVWTLLAYQILVLAWNDLQHADDSAAA